MKVRIFDNRLEKFIWSLEKPTIAKVLRVIDLLELFGNRLNMPHSKKVVGRLFELRIRGTQEVRILYVFSGGEAVLLHGFIKKSRQAPKRDIDIALGKLKHLTSI